MRVAIVAESFLPHMNGVTGSVLHVVHHLRNLGHDTLVIAPKAPGQPEDVAGVEVPETTYLTSVPLPSYPDVRVALAPVVQLKRILAEFEPDMVHLASPAVLGWQGLVAADGLGLPTVAIYQTDVISYAERYGVPGAAPLVQSHIARLHKRATLTLAPSSHAHDQLEGLGVDRIGRWGRGVDAARFSPARRSDSWRRDVLSGWNGSELVSAPSGEEKIVGYVGRLAPEKQVDDLRAVADLPGTRLVVVGDGPERERLERELPGAVFTGFLGGDDLAEAVASFDVFVHPGESETFCQTVQEALASGVPVVATGRGGPVDLVRSSVDGWLYRPGDLDDLRARVADLLGDDAKRASFALAARDSVRSRTWAALTEQLVDHYGEAARLRRFDGALMARGDRRVAAAEAAPTRRWAKFVALGDSLTEGLCDSSRMPDGQYRGWADRLAMLLGQDASRSRRKPFRFANLAVRSRRVRDLAAEQVPAALELKPDLVSILMGHNDLVGHSADPYALAAELEHSVRRLRAAGIDVMLITPFLPRRLAARMFARRFAAYSSELRRIAKETGSILFDSDALPELSDVDNWAADKVHLRSSGHRLIAYRAAEVLGVRDAEQLAALDRAFHEDADDPDGRWITRHVLPWAWRRMRGRTAGDGLSAKHTDYVEVRGRRSRHDGAEAL
ncbi:glycosyltransferase [Microbacterium halotolerans]|uniref:glycosyltransferase n=1 Tax=Microbacterium halotolerans TaxID=246613 RepID=UPI000E6AE2E9|nr:glycosyltransferase [Microbacterium halotolerans]